MPILHFIAHPSARQVMGVGGACGREGWEDGRFFLNEVRIGMEKIERGSTNHQGYTSSSLSKGAVSPAACVYRSYALVLNVNSKLLKFRKPCLRGPVHFQVQSSMV